MTASPYADRTPLRPADLRTAVTAGIFAPEPTAADRIEMERDDLRIQLRRADAEGRSQDRALRELTAERDQAFTELDHVSAALNRAGVSGPGSFGDRIDAAAEALTALHARLAAMTAERDQARREHGEARRIAESLRDDLAAADTVITTARTVTDSTRLSRRALMDLADALRTYDAPPHATTPSPGSGQDRAQDQPDLATRWIDAAGIPVIGRDVRAWLDQLGVPVPVGIWPLMAEIRRAVIAAGDAGYDTGRQDEPAATLAQIRHDAEQHQAAVLAGTAADDMSPDSNPANVAREG
ncbi:hypothetical protein ABT023_16320 [Micromonospora sp. NPDC002296]|uniref:hypothetical protein n=1 Tax=Micromonospora sp. NPDC002296 TaxID=3154271 RepID=UPI0033227722